MARLSAPVGPGQRNNWRDVALIQTWLAHQTKNQLGNVAVTGTYSTDLGAMLAAFQSASSILVSDSKDQGVVRPGSVTFLKLMLKVPVRVRKVRFAWKNERSVIAFDANGSSGTHFSVPSKKEIRLHDRATTFLQGWLRHALVGFRVVERKITLDGDLEVELAPVNDHYDLDRHIFKAGLPETYFKEFLKAFHDPSYRFLRSNSGNLRFIWKVSGDLFKPPLALIPLDKKRLKYRRVPSGKTLPSDSFHDAVLASLAKPWRQIKDIDENRGRYLVPAEGFKKPNYQQRRVASEILDHYGAYSKNIEATYKLINERAGKRDATAPLVKVSVGASATVLVGLSIEVGLIVDLNTRKEYLVLDASIMAGLELGFGLTTGVDALYQPIEDILNAQGFSISSSVSKEFEVGPIKFSFGYKNEKTKIPPDVEWDGFKLNLGDVLDLEKRNVSEVAADMKTGERIPTNKQKESKEEDGKNGRKKGPGVELSIATIDFGSVVLKVTALPKVSSKLSAQWGPKYSYDYKAVFEIEYDGGWKEILLYSLLKSIVPERHFQKYELFPPI